MDIDVFKKGKSKGSEEDALPKRRGKGKKTKKNIVKVEAKPEEEKKVKEALIKTGAKVAGAWIVSKGKEKMKERSKAKKYKKFDKLDRYDSLAHARKGKKYKKDSIYREDKPSPLFDSSEGLNFLKAPKDKPSDVFGGLFNAMTKPPQKVELPDSVKKYIKDTFRLF